MFSQDDQDVGNAPEPQMKIRLKDDITVQQNHSTMPNHLYGEMKQYIEDLLNRQWVINSYSEYLPSVTR